MFLDTRLRGYDSYLAYVELDFFFQKPFLYPVADAPGL